MNRGMIVLGILMFAVAGAVLYIWGLKKSISQGEDLQRMLLGKTGNKVLKYLRKNETITEKEIVGLVAGTQAGQFWSKRRVTVQDPKKFTKQLTEYLFKQQYIEAADKGCYRLKK